MYLVNDNEETDNETKNGLEEENDSISTNNIVENESIVNTAGAGGDLGGDDFAPGSTQQRVES